VELTAGSCDDGGFKSFFRGSSSLLTMPPGTHGSAVAVMLVMLSRCGEKSTLGVGEAESRLAGSDKK